MKKVTKIQKIEPLPKEFEYTLELEDGHESQVKLMREMGEWILVGDSRQHLCRSELVAILKVIDKLNDKYTDCEDDDEEEESYY